MDQSNCADAHDKTRNTIFIRLADRIFARADRAAAERGWEVRRERGGLRRSYRDPRFDRVRARQP